MVALVYGQRGAGKSVRARWLVRQTVFDRTGRGSAVGLVVDTLREYNDLPAVHRKSVQWYRHRAQPGSQARLLVPDQQAFDEVAAQLSQSIVHVDADGPSTPARVVLMVEEVSYWSKPTWTCAGLSRLIRYGRHLHVDLIAVCRRPAETSRELSSQADLLIVQGAVVEPGDLQYLARIMPPQAIENIGALKRWEAVEYRTDGTYSTLAPVKI